MTAEQAIHHSHFLRVAFSDHQYFSIAEKMIAYSIYSYQQKDHKFEQIGEKEKYQFACQMMFKNNFYFPFSLKQQPEQTYQFLKETDLHYKKVAIQNKARCSAYVDYVEEQFLKYAPIESTPESQLEYIFDFISSYIKNIEEGISWTTKIPSLEGITMDPCCQTPIADPFKETIVFRGGDSYQLSALFVRFAKQLNPKLAVKTLSADYIDSPHFFNCYITTDGVISMIDVTGMFRGVPKGNCFLVSGSKLNENHAYHFPIYTNIFRDQSVTLECPESQQVHSNVEKAMKNIDAVYEETYGKQFAYPKLEKTPFVKQKQL